MSVGLSVEWGRTGAQSVGAEQFNVLCIPKTHLHPDVVMMKTAKDHV